MTLLLRPCQQAREAAQAETDKVLAGLEGPHPEGIRRSLAELSGPAAS